jgi:hypothetical protein
MQKRSPVGVRFDSSPEPILAQLFFPAMKQIMLITRQNVIQLSKSQTEGVKRADISIDHDV